MVNRFLFVLAALFLSASHAYSQTYSQSLSAPCTPILGSPIAHSCPAGQGFSYTSGSYVKLSSNGNSVVSGTVSDIASQFVGVALKVVQSNVIIQTSGLATINFDGATTSGDTFTLSTTTAGYFHDTGSTTCSATTLGVVSQTIGSAGQATAFLGPCTPSNVTGVVPGWILLSKLAAANFNSTADQAIAISLPPGITKYIIRSITVTNASVSLTTAAGGFYPAATKGGTAIVAAAQTYSALTGATLYQDCTIATSISNTQTTIYLSLTTAQGSAATADIYVYGEPLP